MEEKPQRCRRPRSEIQASIRAWKRTCCASARRVERVAAVREPTSLPLASMGVAALVECGASTAPGDELAASRAIPSLRSASVGIVLAHGVAVANGSCLRAWSRRHARNRRRAPTCPQGAQHHPGRKEGHPPCRYARAGTRDPRGFPVRMWRWLRPYREHTTKQTFGSARRKEECAKETFGDESRHQPFTSPLAWWLCLLRNGLLRELAVATHGSGRPPILCAPHDLRGSSCIGDRSRACWSTHEVVAGCP